MAELVLLGQDLQPLSHDYITAATSQNTRKAYRSDIAHYETWGGKLPASPEYLLAYLHAFATSLNPRTLGRRLVALKQWHVYQQFPDPTLNPTVKKTMIGILRLHGKPKAKARPVLPDELALMAHCLSTQPTLAAARDNALLQIGFLGGLRRSELVAIQFEHLRFEPAGLEILLPSSKTDQQNMGQYCAIPHGNSKLCAISALKQWLAISNITAGPLFRRVFGDDQLGLKPLTPLMVNQILKKRALEANIPDPQTFSSHSLRRGLATCAARAGAPLQAIMRAGRWKQTNTVLEYIEASDRFSDNAAQRILAQIE